MRTIWKFQIPIIDRFSVSMPRGAEVLSVQVQYGQAVMWALVDASAMYELRHFSIVGTGNPIQGPLGRFVGTFSPSPNTGNAVTTWVMRLNAVALTRKTDFYILNNGTAYALNSGWVLKAQCWTPG